MHASCTTIFRQNNKKLQPHRVIFVCFMQKMFARVSVVAHIQNVPCAVHLGRFPVLSKPDSVPPAKLTPADSLFLPLARRPHTVGLHLCDRVRGPPLKLDTTKPRSPHCTKNSRKQVLRFCVVRRGWRMRVWRDVCRRAKSRNLYLRLNRMIKKCIL